MPLGEPPTYSVAQIERKAHDFLQARLGHNVQIPIDVEILLERMDGVVLDVWPKLREGHGVAGMVLRDLDSGELLIHIDDWIADNVPNWYRSTVAEELGHIVLHRQMIDQVTEYAQFRELQNHGRWYEMERNVKRFGAAILMPAGHVIKQAASVYPRLVSVAGYDNVPAIMKYMAYQLSKTFEVSQETMRYRLTEWPIKINEKVKSAMRDGLDYLA